MNKVPTDGEIKKMATRKPPAGVRTADRSQPKSRGGRALFTGLCRISRKSRSDAIALRACEWLGVLERIWTVKDVLALDAPSVAGPKSKPDIDEAVLQELKASGDEKLMPHLPETGAGLADLMGKYGINK